MGSVAINPGVPKLTHLERIGPKGYLRYVFPFELPKDYDDKEVARVLRDGYAAAKARLPVMACEAVPDLECKRKSDRCPKNAFRNI